MIITKFYSQKPLETFVRGKVCIQNKNNIRMGVHLNLQVLA